MEYNYFACFNYLNNCLRGIFLFGFKRVVFFKKHMKCLPSMSPWIWWLMLYSEDIFFPTYFPTLWLLHSFFLFFLDISWAPEEVIQLGYFTITRGCGFIFCGSVAPVHITHHPSFQDTIFYLDSVDLRQKEDRKIGEGFTGKRHCGVRVRSIRQVQWPVLIIKY